MVELVVLLCSSMWKGPQEYITYELVTSYPVVSCMFGSSNFDCSILFTAFWCRCRQAFPPYVLLASMQCIHIVVSIRPLLGRNCASFYLHNKITVLERYLPFPLSKMGRSIKISLFLFYCSLYWLKQYLSFTDLFLKEQNWLRKFFENQVLSDIFLDDF